MTLLAPAALAGLLLMPVLVVFYLFRPEPRQQKSTTYFLWKRAVPESSGGRFATRLQNNPLLWLQLLILLLLILFLARLATPWNAKVPTSNRVVLMIDRSASMKAGGSFESARSQATEAVESMLGRSFMGSSPEVMLIAVDAQPQVLVPFTKDANSLLRALREIRPTDKSDQLEGMGPFVRSLIKAHRAKIWLFGDHLPQTLEVPGLQFTSVAVESNNNVGVVSFSVQAPDPERGQDRPFLYARLENFSTVAQQRLVRLEKLDAEDPDKVLATLWERTALLSAQSGETLVEPLSASRFETDAASVFRLSVLPILSEQADSFAADDRAYTVSAPFRDEKVLVATAPGVKAGFLLRAVAASTDVRVVELQALAAQPDPPPVDLLIAAKGFNPPSQLKVRSRFLLAPPPSDDKATASRLDEVKDDTPLVGASGVEWSRQRVQITDTTKPATNETTLLTAQGQPALSLGGTSTGTPTLHWRFPLEYSSLPLSSGLPVIVGRFVDRFSRATGVPYPGSLATDSQVSRPIGAVWKGALQVTPLTEEADALGEVLQVAPDSSSFKVPKQAGVYRLAAKDASEVIAVNLFSSGESALPQTLSDKNFEITEESQEQATTDTGTQYKEVLIPLLGLAFLLLLLEAALFLKRGRP